MGKNHIVIVVILVGLALGFGFFALQNGSNTGTGSTTTLPTEKIYLEEEGNLVYEEYFRSDQTAILCQHLKASGTACNLYAFKNGDLVNLRMRVEDEPRALLPAADRTTLIVTLETSLVLLDLTSLQKTILFDAPSGTVLGVYDEFPMFKPQTVLQGDSIILALYNADTFVRGDGSIPAPRETRSFSLK